MTHNWPQLIDHCFSRTQYMTLATQGASGPWATPLYFSWDDKFNLYFISKLDTQHAQNLTTNPATACSIFPTDQNTLGRILGVSATGIAHHITDPGDRKKADDFYFDRLHPNDPIAREVNGYRTNPDWHMFKVTLSGLWYFDTDHFGEHRMAVPENEWK